MGYEWNSDCNGFPWMDYHEDGYSVGKAWRTVFEGEQ